MTDQDKQLSSKQTLDATIMIIEDDPDHAHLIKKCLEQVESLNVTLIVCNNLENSKQLLSSENPDLILLDYQLESESSLEFLQSIRSGGDTRPVVVLTSQGNEYVAVDMMRAGANNYIVKADLSTEILENALYPLIHESINNKLMRSNCQAVLSRLDTLTPREREVLNRIIQGQTNRQIAESLSRSENTIKIHRSRVMQKMHAQTPADLVRMVLAAESTTGSNSYEK